MDIQSFNPEKAVDAGAWLVLKDPTTGKATDARIKLAGEAGKRWRDKEDEDRDKRFAKAKQANGEIEATSDELRRRNCKLLAAVTLEWEHIDNGGKPLACNESHAFQLYSLHHWIYAQAWAFANNPTNYGEGGEENTPSLIPEPEVLLANEAANFSPGQSGDSATLPIDGK